MTATVSDVPRAKASRRKGPREGTRQKADALLAAAAALIAEKGYEATAIRDVGRRLEVSLGGMYYYFSSKDDLLFQIQLRTFQSLLQAQQRAAAVPGVAVERLRRLLVGHLDFSARHPHEMKICTYELESLTGDRYERVRAVRRRYYRVVADVVTELLEGAPRKGRETTRSRHITLFVFGMLNWSLTWYRAAKDGPVDTLADEMMSLLAGGAVGTAPVRS